MKWEDDETKPWHMKDIYVALCNISVMTLLRGVNSCLQFHSISCWCLCADFCSFLRATHSRYAVWKYWQTNRYTYVNICLLTACLSITQSHVTAGDQLVHSAFLQSLASLAVGLSLEQQLCCYPCPPHHTSPDTPLCPSEWSWLATYATAVHSAEAIARGTAFPESFVVPEFQEAGAIKISKALVSSDI